MYNQALQQKAHHPIEATHTTADSYTAGQQGGGDSYHGIHPRTHHTHVRPIRKHQATLSELNATNMQVMLTARARGRNLEGFNHGKNHVSKKPSFRIAERGIAETKLAGSNASGATLGFPMK